LQESFGGLLNALFHAVDGLGRRVRVILGSEEDVWFVRIECGTEVTTFLGVWLTLLSDAEEKYYDWHPTKCRAPDYPAKYQALYWPDLLSTEACHPLLKFSLTDEFYEEETTAPKGRKGDDGGADKTAEGPGHQTSLAFIYLRFESFEQQLDLQPGSEGRMCYKMVICDVGLAEMGSSFPFCI
jgi:hypothetical protein